MKTVVISGASAGIGRACAEYFARAGFQVIAGARRSESLKEISQKISSESGSKVLAHSLDVCDQYSIDSFASFVFKNCHAPDVVINNAGMAAGVDPIASAKAEDWQRMLDTNVMGLLRFTRAFLPSMLEKKKGHIVNISSIAGHHSYAGGGVYAGTKHAVKAIGESLRLELNGTPIRVTAISPGMVETEFSKVRFNDQEKAKAVYKGMTPLTANDIAECVLFAAQRPAHVNIDDIIIMPTDQASIYKVHREN